MVYIFDVDGTLTPSRLPMTKEFRKFFLDWLADKNVYLVSGSDYKKLKEQLPRRVLNDCNGVFSAMGNEFHVDGQVVYSNDDEIPEKCIKFLEKWIIKTKCDLPKGKLFFEKRVGALNFSTIGRDVSQEIRDAYYAWDNENQERLKIAKEFNKKFSGIGYTAKVGGQLSLDIQKSGKDKSQVITYLNNIHADPYYMFFGDRTYEGGNDFDIANKIVVDKLGEVFQVESPEQCAQILQILEEEE